MKAIEWGFLFLKKSRTATKCKNVKHSKGMREKERILLQRRTPTLVMST